MHSCSVEVFAANFTIMQNPNKLIYNANQIIFFLYEKNIGLKGDLVQFSWVKIFKQKKGFTLPAPKGQR